MQIQRDQYLNRLLEDRGNRRIKIVTGVRRCGKSYLLFKLFKDRLTFLSVFFSDSERVCLNALSITFISLA